ncbi:MAG: hypothetical protein ACKV2V_24140 [Blastocatellia bacterium]
MNSLEQITLTPLSAGDIIDRAVRIYRRQFRPLLQIVLWPSLISYAGVIALSFGQRNLALNRGDGRLMIGIGMIMGGVFVYLLGKIAFYVVLGGAAKSLVGYLLDGAAIRPSEVYQAVRQRFWPLTGATLMMMLITFAAFVTIYMISIMIIALYVMSVGWALAGAPRWLQMIVHGGAVLTLFAGLIFAGLQVFKRLIFIPQAMMVEGRGVFAAIARSFALAGSDIRQVFAIVFFDVWLTFAMLFLLIAPLGWYAWLQGVNLLGDDNPLWYNIAYQTLSQVSEILLGPVAMLGFTLLYIDRRVRQEGFDVELLASRYLGPVPAPPAMPARAAAMNGAMKPAPSVHSANGLAAGSTTDVPAQAAPRACAQCGYVIPEARFVMRFCQLCGAALPDETHVSTPGETIGEEIR